MDLSHIASLVFFPLLLTVFGVIFLAAIGKSIGIRYVYMQVLLATFEV